MRRCRFCGCCLPDGARKCLACGKTQDVGDDERSHMTNQTVKENLLIMLEEYAKLNVTDESKRNARKTTLLALKAIGLYDKEHCKELDEE